MTIFTDTVRFAEAYLRTGVRLHYAATGEPGRPALVLLHGYSDSWFSYSQSLPALAESFHCFAPSQRGHGDSDRPADGYTMQDLAADVVAFMDALGIARATLVGHSMGSLVAQQVALDAPERVERLVLAGAIATGDIELVHELKQAIDVLSEPVPEAFVREFQLSTIYGSLPDGFLERAIAESLKLSAYVWRGLAAAMATCDYTARLGEIGAPTLILWGDRDTTFDRSHSEALRSGIHGAIMKVYPETGHALHWERPAQFARDLAAFLGA
jgi:non-heme chloroperoxidase